MRVAKNRRLKRKARKARQRARWKAAFEAAIAFEGDFLERRSVFPEWLSVRPMEETE
jgi:hypothetical protein